MNEAWGKYYICRCVRHFSHQGEFTNVGVALYSSAGNLLLAKADTPERAVRRGDLAAIMASHCDREYFQGFMENYGNLADIEHHSGSIGAAMSCVQLHPGGATRIELGTMDDLFDRIVLGKDLS